MKRYKVLEGSHGEGSRLYAKGEVFESEADLEKIFPGRFQCLGDALEKGPDPVQDLENEEERQISQDSPQETTEEPPQEQEPLPTIEGELVDGEFKFSPEDTGLHVYQRGNRYFVYDIDNLEKPLNSKGLQKSKVQKFLNAQCEG